MPNTVPDPSAAEIAVAVGVIYNARGEVLITRRHANQHQGGLWELPGGKIEAGEVAYAALQRELHEELGLVVDAARPLIEIPWRYADKAVRLQTFRVISWHADVGHDFSVQEGVGREQQPWRWQASDALLPDQFPAANRPLLRALQLPSRFLISGRASDRAEWLRRLRVAYKRGIRWVQIRWPQEWPMPDITDLQHWLADIRTAFPQDARDPLHLVWNGEPETARLLPVDGVHLNRQALLESIVRPELAWVSASCHSPEELARAAALGLDFVWLSPVLPTPSHPEATGLGWDCFARWVRAAQLPVYDLGGVGEAEITHAQAAGAQGVAAISAWWKLD